MIITKERFEELQKAEAKLLALEKGGVINWKNYDSAIKPFRIAEELKRKRKYLIDKLASIFDSYVCESSEQNFTEVLEKLNVVFENKKDD